MRLVRAILPPLSILILLFPSFGQTNEKKDKEPAFIRITRSPKKSIETMETAIVRYVSTDPNKADVSVDLIGAVHVGEMAYYQALNRAFENYDAVLYELVAPEGHNVPKQTARDNSIISSFQRSLKRVLNLEFQLDHIDYTKKNFVHADMSPKQFSETMSKRNESVVGMMMKMMKESMAMQAKGKMPSDFELLMALFNNDQGASMKRLMAEQFANMDMLMGALSGPEGSTILTERNDVALKVLKTQLGKGKKKIAIFYGAAHLPDMHKKLVKDFGMKVDGERWLVAWDMREKSRAPKKADRSTSLGPLE